ncbi:MAG: hypothetical protein AAF328_00220 [Planctomycetota bacterium]
MMIKKPRYFATGIGLLFASLIVARIGDGDFGEFLGLAIVIWGDIFLANAFGEAG